MAEIEYEEWFDKYKPIEDDHGSLRIYETYGEDLDFIQSIAEDNRVWTYLDGDGYSSVVNGMFYVNRLCYYVTEVPWEGEPSDIEISMYEAYECDITGEHQWVDYVRAIDNNTIKVCDFCEMSKDDWGADND
jgi:hypothetical protein